MSKSKYLFSNLDELKTFRDDIDTAIVTDIDGTISKIAPTPDSAFVDPLIRKFLFKLVGKFKLVAAVSGRCVEDARQMLAIDGILYVGNHGLEYLKDGERYIEPEVVEILPYLNEVAQKIQQEELSEIPGIIFEEKGVCFSIHYRQCKDSEKTKKMILDCLKNLESKDMKVTQGRRLVEIRPPVAYNKGSILEKIIVDNNLKKVIYLGDDITDVDAFDKIKEMVSLNKIKGASIAVESEEVPEYVMDRADYLVNNVDQVGRFFQWLTEN
ncbi:MAG: trehalose-phosphatase [Methanomicrobiales archaeon]